MSIYMIIDIEITDPETYAEYVKRIPPIIEKFGGRYLTRGGKVTPLAGDWNPGRIILLEFPSFEHVKNWLMSKEHMPLAEIRRKSTTARAILVEGCSPDPDGENA